MTEAARVGSWSLRSRLAALVAIVAVLFGAAALIVGLSLSRLSDTLSQQVDHIDPADIVLIDLMGQYTNQETGIRAYALRSQQQYLEPYTSGVSLQNRDIGRLKVYLRGKPSQLADAAAMVAAGETWRAAVATPIIQHRPLAPAVDADLGKSYFDAIRNRYDTLHNTIAAERTSNRTKLRHAELEVVIAAAIGTFVLVVAGVLLWLSLRRWVIHPLTRLRDDVGQVSSGDLSHEIHPFGPHETAEVGRDVELMRRRLVGDLEELAAAQFQLEQAAADLERRAADLGRSNADLEQFAYVASHDLQEPLRKVASFTQLLQQRYSGQLDEKADTYIAFAVDGAKRMQRLIDDLLAFSRVGRSTSGFEDVDLEDCLARVRETLSTTISAASAEVVSHGLPVVQGDAALLTQLLQNLLGNAVKFRAPGRIPKVEFGGSLVGDEWQLWCRDNGIGIEPEYAEKVFVIFQRLHGRDEYAGTGIGLALCKKIVEFHGGRIRVESALPPGADPSSTTGTTVSWTLPGPAVVPEARSPVSASEVAL